MRDSLGAPGSTRIKASLGDPKAEGASLLPRVKYLGVSSCKIVSVL